MRNKDRILVYIFLFILFVIISGLLYQSNKIDKINKTNILNSAVSPSIEKFEFDHAINTATNALLTDIPQDFRIQQSEPINSRSCTVYRVDDTNTTIDQHLRDLCDNGFFDRSLNDINNRLQYLNSKPVNALTTAEQTELYDINNYYQKYKDIPYKACKVDLFNWYEPTKISNNDQNIVKNDLDTVNRDPTSWAYCYKPISTTSININDKNTDAANIAQNVANSGKGINADPLTITTDLTSYVSPFNDNNIYSRVVFNTFTVDDFIKKPVDPNAKVINGNICAADNLPGNISDITNRMRANYLVFQLQDTANTVALFNPANFNKTTHRFEIISEPAYLRNIYAQLFVDVTNIAPQNDQNIICSPNTLGSAFVHMLRNDICNDPAMKGKIFEKSGRVIDIKNQTTFPFSLATNLGVPSTTLGQTVNNMTISQLQQQIINVNADIVAKQADIQQQRNNIASAESIIRDLEISLAGAIIAAIFNPTALYVIAGNIALQQQYISGYQSQIASDSQAIINDLNTIINYLNTIQTLEGQFLSMIDNYVNEKNPAFLIGNTFTNFDFTKESNDANIYVYIGQDLVTTNGIYDNMKIYCYSQNCTASQAVSMPIPCQLRTANGLLTSMTGINEAAVRDAANARTLAEWKSTGCYNDNTDCRLIPHKLNNTSLNSAQNPLLECINLANHAGYDTIGLQDGNCYGGKADKDGNPLAYNLKGESKDVQCSTGNFGSALTNKVYTKNANIPQLPQDVPGYIGNINLNCQKYSNEHFTNYDSNSKTTTNETFANYDDVETAKNACNDDCACSGVIEINPGKYTKTSTITQTGDTLPSNSLSYSYTKTPMSTCPLPSPPGRAYTKIDLKDFPYNDINYYSGSFDDCAKTCDDTPGCIAYATKKDKGSDCWLKNSLNQDNGPKSHIFRDTYYTDVVILYINCDLSGKSMSFPVGEYNWLPDVGFPNDALSSISIPAGLTVDLYWDWHFEGEKITFVGPRDIRCLLDTRSAKYPWLTWNDQASSMKVRKSDSTSGTVTTNTQNWISVPNIDHYGDDISSYHCTSLDDCKNKCANDPTCTTVIADSKSSYTNAWAKKSYDNWYYYSNPSDITNIRTAYFKPNVKSSVGKDYVFLHKTGVDDSAIESTWANDHMNPDDGALSHCDNIPGCSGVRSCGFNQRYISKTKLNNGQVHTQSGSGCSTYIKNT